LRSDADTGFTAGTAIACAGLLLVPLLRARAHALTGHAATAEADVAGFVACGGGAAPRLLLLDDALADALRDASACSAWLAARPALVADIRARITAVGDGRTASGPRRPLP
jgi:hypothetical protein